MFSIISTIYFYYLLALLCLALIGLFADSRARGTTETSKGAFRPASPYQAEPMLSSLKSDDVLSTFETKKDREPAKREGSLSKKLVNPVALKK